MTTKTLLKELSNQQLFYKEEILRLEGIIANLKFKLGMKDILLGTYGNSMGAVAADLLINPNPIQIHATEAGKGYDYMVSLNNVLLVEGNKRIKTIHFLEPVIPIEGGKKRFKIEANESFDSILNKLQKSGHHILRVNTSLAINIYHYELSKPGRFVLISKAPDYFQSLFSIIETDNNFDAQLYHTRLMEIDRLNKHHQEFSVSLRKMEEINRYKK